MTISESLINWLLQYDTDVDGIDTDIISATTTSYALSKEPIINTKRYLSGAVQKTEYYQFTARLDSQTNAERKDNTAWLEGLERWIEEQKKLGNVPQVGSKSVIDVVITSGFYMGQNAEDDAIYSLTIAVKYEA